MKAATSAQISKRPSVVLSKKPSVESSRMKPSDLFTYNNLTILNQISSGLSADIFIAKTKLGEKLVIKIFKNETDHYYKNELNFISQKISSPNIVKFCSFGQIKEPQDKYYNHHYLIMEYSQKGDLFTMLEKQKKISESIVKKIMLQVLSGLEALHSKGFIHRDIKPENILVFNNEYKLTDFGFCEEIKKCSGSRNGTHGYIPPEILEKKKFIPENIDSFGFGVTAFTMITGEFPFDNPTINDLNYSFIINNDWNGYWRSVGNPLLSNEFKKLFQSLVCYDTNKRLKINQIRNSEWFQNSKL